MDLKEKFDRARNIKDELRNYLGQQTGDSYNLFNTHIIDFLTLQIAELQLEIEELKKDKNE